MAQWINGWTTHINGTLHSFGTSGLVSNLVSSIAISITEVSLSIVPWLCDMSVVNVTSSDNEGSTGI